MRITRSIASAGVRLLQVFGLAVGAWGLAHAQSGGPTAEYRLGAYDPYATFATDARIRIEHIYLPWLDSDLSSLNTADEYARSRGRDLLITVEPWSWSQSRPVEPASLYAGVMSGRYDSVIQAICGTSAALKSPVTIRWGHEMDLANKRYPWSQWSPEQYVNAYRHFVGICRPVASNAKFMWSPRGEASLQDYYPGEQFVDSIGLSIFGYQKYEVGVHGKSLTLTDRLSAPYRLVLGYAKPIFIAEFGCNGDSNYRARCMAEVKTQPAEFDRIVGVVYFNEVETYPWPAPYGLPDWRDPLKTLTQAQ